MYRSSWLVVHGWSDHKEPVTRGKAETRRTFGAFFWSKMIWEAIIQHWSRENKPSFFFEAKLRMPVDNSHTFADFVKTRVCLYVPMLSVWLTEYLPPPKIAMREKQLSPPYAWYSMEESMTHMGCWNLLILSHCLIITIYCHGLE